MSPAEPQAAAQSSPEAATKRPVDLRSALLWVGLLTLVIRLLFLAAYSSSALFAMPLLDGKYYDTAARVLVEGLDPQSVGGGFRPWLYPALLALAYAVAGDWGRELMLLGQHLAGVATAVMVAWLAGRLYRRAAAAWLAGLLYALAAPPLFFESQLLITAHFTALTTAVLVVLSWEGPGRRLWLWPLAAAVVALAAQLRPNALVMLVAFLPWLLLRDGSEAPGRRRAAGWALLAAVVTLALAAGIQRPLAGSWQWIPGSGGVNLYLGNARGADGMVPRQDRWVTYGEEYRDSVEVFARAEYEAQVGSEPATPSEVSSFWVRRTVTEVVADPLAWFGLMARKGLYLLWNHEIPNNLGFHFVAEDELPWLSWFPVRWWLLLALAPMGLLVAHRARRGVSSAPDHLYWQVAWVVLASVAILAFFVNARYRLPLWPVLAVWAAGGALGLADLVVERRWRRLAAAGLVVSVVAFVSLVDRPWAEPEHPERDLFFRSLARLEKGDLTGAAADADRSLALRSEEPATHFQRAAVALAADDDVTAFQHLRRAAELAPDEPRVYGALALLNERLGRDRAAYRGYLWALAISRDEYGPALVGAALLELRAGLVERAERRLVRVREVGYTSASQLCAEAFLSALQGRAAEADALLQRALALDPETTARRLEDQQNPLDPAFLDLGGGA